MGKKSESDMRQFIEDYSAAIYRVNYLEQWIDFSVGNVSDPISQLCEKEKASCFAFITADNPASLRLDFEANQIRQKQLVRFLNKKNFRYFSGYSTNAQASWPKEKSYFILAVDIPQAKEIALKFEQNAFLWGKKHSPVELIWTKTD